MPGLRILVLDGGGSKGFFTLEVLRYIELACGRPIRDCFDLIVGTSIGAFLAGCIVAGRTIDEIESQFLPMITMFEQVSRSTLSRLVWGHVLDASAWTPSMHAHFGDMRLSDLPESPRLLMLAADASTLVPHPFLIRNQPLPDSGAPRSPFGTTTDMRLLDALQAATAAPTVYPAYNHKGTPIVDGGVLANNPVLFALAEATLLGAELECIVSVGTGVEPRAPVGPSRGLMGWSWALIKRSTDSDTAADLALGILPPSKYVRFDPPDVGGCNTWESNPEVLCKLRQQVQTFMHSHQETLSTLIPHLCHEKPAVEDNEDGSVSNTGGS